ncbi:hypothetical protein RRG08_047438 [Elysia crispata]|uniref:Uncharacterized protein n=1 Tax=Elysia crispata TaxID=231223 RepID=A0AAE1D4Q8_9GAST|nr:hypothetical protein RRG08_047438 [Elysia crispata]
MTSQAYSWRDCEEVTMVLQTYLKRVSSFVTTGTFQQSEVFLEMVNTLGVYRDGAMAENDAYWRGSVQHVKSVLSVACQLSLAGNWTVRAERAQRLLSVYSRVHRPGERRAFDDSQGNTETCAELFVE